VARAVTGTEAVTGADAVTGAGAVTVAWARSVASSLTVMTLARVAGTGVDQGEGYAMTAISDEPEETESSAKPIGADTGIASAKLPITSVLRR